MNLNFIQLEFTSKSIELNVTSPLIVLLILNSNNQYTKIQIKVKNIILLHISTIISDMYDWKFIFMKFS